MSDAPNAAGDPCPKCGAALVLRHCMFYWRGSWFDGLYCDACNAGWDPGDRFLTRALDAGDGRGEVKP